MYLKSISAIIVSCAVLVACSSTKPEPQKDALPAVTNATPTAKSTVAQVVIPDHLNPNSLLSQNKSVYFDYETQIETTSWGREKPIDPGHNEQAWAKNRRADIVYN